MVLGLLQTLRSMIRFWNQTADIGGAHDELERHLAGANGAESAASDSAERRV